MFIVELHSFGGIVIELMYAVAVAAHYSVQ